MDIWQILGYVVAVVFNIGVVVAIRAKAWDAGRKFLASGRFALIAVYVLCVLELLVVGRFDALQDAALLVKLLQDAWVLAGAAVGTHAAAKTALEAGGVK